MNTTTSVILKVYNKLYFRRVLVLVLSIVVFVFASITAISVGSIWIPPEEIWRSLIEPCSSAKTDVNCVIIREVRLPRFIMVALTGAALASAGVIIQGVLRNPLAGPYVLGISSGAGFGAALAVVTDLIFILPLPFFSFIGALVAFVIGYSIAGGSEGSPVSFILAGIAVSSLFSALTSFMMYCAGEKLEIIVFWLMGHFSGIGKEQVLITMLIIVPCIIPLTFFGNLLNIISLGDKAAVDLGTNPKAIRTGAIVIASLVVSTTVCFTGIIGFVGLVIPHILRMMGCKDNRFLIPSSLFMGAGFLNFADVLSRTLVIPSEIPIGIITSLVGVPFFMYLLRKRGNEYRW